MDESDVYNVLVEAGLKYPDGTTLSFRQYLAKIICQRFGTSPVKVPEKKTTICYFDSLVHNWNDCVDEFYRLNPELLKNGDKNNDKKK